MKRILFLVVVLFLTTNLLLAEQNDKRINWLNFGLGSGARDMASFLFQSSSRNVNRSFTVRFGLNHTFKSGGILFQGMDSSSNSGNYTTAYLNCGLVETSEYFRAGIFAGPSYTNNEEYPVFGFNNPSPSSDRNDYGYEF